MSKGDPVMYKELTPEHKQKFDEIKALLEADDEFRDLNRATQKDEYLMPVVETLINTAASNKILSFMDGNAGYNQIFMAPEDIHKTAF
jgi:hypothetical protein